MSVITSAVAFALSSSAYGGTVPVDDTRNIGENAPVESWLLSAGSTLNVLPGASTLEISAVDGATLNITSGTVSTAFEGINLISSTANLTNATVVSTGSYGLLVNRGGSSNSGPASAVVSGGVYLALEAAFMQPLKAKLTCPV